MAHVRNWGDIATVTDDRGVTKKVIEGHGATLVNVTVPAGLAASRHHHDHEQFVQVISGSGELETEEGKKPFGPGSIFFFPADTWHTARFDTDTMLIETNMRRVTP